MSKREELKHQKEQDPIDSKVYDSLFNLLERQPKDSLSENFSKNVIQRIQKREKSRRTWFYIWSVVGVLFCTVATISIFIFYFGAESLSNLMDATGWAVFAGLSIVIIQYFDRKLIHKKGMQTI